ncbi:CRAL-TRIO lipid binding domain-containing protein [Artemisia annua]|uniref:CRAL-TRIO lipid binding domain-containing protein n=1 Tax=Artemisia annua TaxID=35608 RepID=A0A2U1N0L2_ARTAN|nr:CRAL-TRIO lipid binding domain-containing protein [Artemisia annua]
MSIGQACILSYRIQNNGCLKEHVAEEAATGKIYRSSFMDSTGGNTKSTQSQIKYLVYCMENAIFNLPPEQEQMVWLIDFNGFSLSNISIKSTKETAHILQDHYPERLGLAILYNPPKLFEPFWKVTKPFLEPKTANKHLFITVAVKLDGWKWKVSVYSIPYGSTNCRVYYYPSDIQLLVGERDESLIELVSVTSMIKVCLSSVFDGVRELICDKD